MTFPGRSLGTRTFEQDGVRLVFSLDSNHSESERDSLRRSEQRLNRPRNATTRTWCNKLGATRKSFCYGEHSRLAASSEYTIFTLQAVNRKFTRPVQTFSPRWQRGVPATAAKVIRVVIGQLASGEVSQGGREFRFSRGHWVWPSPGPSRFARELSCSPCTAHRFGGTAELLGLFIFPADFRER